MGIPVLLIEDDTGISEFLARGLATEGFDVTCASAGRPGLELAQTGQFDAIILDIMLPDFDGLELCRTLRMERKRVPILILSALDTTGDIVRGLRFGADDYMTKPFAFEELLARLH
ncbi:MAG: response regulator, partial [Pseudomonadota bacterium]